MYVALKNLTDLLQLPSSSTIEIILLQIKQLMLFKANHSICKTTYSTIISQIQQTRILIQSKLNEQIKHKMNSQIPKIVINQRVMNIQQYGKQLKNNKILKIERCVVQQRYMTKNILWKYKQEKKQLEKTQISSDEMKEIQKPSPIKKIHQKNNNKNTLI